MEFSKLIVMLVLLLNIVFTSVVMWLFYTVGSEPTGLIAAWFAFTTTELWALSKIKRVEKGENQDAKRYMDKVKE